MRGVRRAERARAEVIHLSHLAKAQNDHRLCGLKCGLSWKLSQWSLGTIRG